VIGSLLRVATALDQLALRKERLAVGSNILSAVSQARHDPEAGEHLRIGRLEWENRSSLACVQIAGASAREGLRGGTSMEIHRAFRRLTLVQRNTFIACFLGWSLDAFDFFILTFCVSCHCC